MPFSVAIFVYPDVEVLDFAGPYEVFTTASRVHGRRHVGAPPPFTVFTVAREAGLVRARAGLEIKPDHTFAQHPAIDVLLVPGGVVTAELQRPDLIQWLAVEAGRARLTASVCTGSFLLAAAGVLRNKAATTHWEDIADLRSQFPELDVRENVRWMDEGTVVTSAGISAGIDMSLHLVERLAGRELALATARQMDVVWTEAS